MPTLVPKWFIRYKFLNSVFLGLSVGTIFTIYEPLTPSIYSAGGILLAIGMLIVARFYSKILNSRSFFIISVLVEVLLLLSMLYFLWYPYTYQTALVVYIGYQATFVFGSYLVRAETLLLQSKALLTSIDTAKQVGYLFGMLSSYLFYRAISYYDITNPQIQVYNLHFLLICIEVCIIALVFKSFSNSEHVN